MPIFEPDLEPIVRRNLKEGRLRFTTAADAGIAHGTILFIAVGTPQGEDGSADLTFVNAVAASVGNAIEGPRTIVIKSTVPVGTGDAVDALIGTALAGRGVSSQGVEVVSNPEFLREGSAVADSMKPDRIIVGTQSPEAEQVLRRLYAPFNRNHETIVVMDRRSAELTKYAANAMLATKISFMNEIANIAEALGADVEKVRRGIGADPRIGYHFIYPGHRLWRLVLPQGRRGPDPHGRCRRRRAGAAQWRRAPAMPARSWRWCARWNGISAPGCAAAASRSGA